VLILTVYARGDLHLALGRPMKIIHGRVLFRPAIVLWREPFLWRPASRGGVRFATCWVGTIFLIVCLGTRAYGPGHFFTPTSHLGFEFPQLGTGSFVRDVWCGSCVPVHLGSFMSVGHGAEKEEENRRNHGARGRAWI